MKIDDSYKKVDKKDIEYLIEVLGKDRVFSGDEINKDFSHDELGGIEKMPDVLVEANTTEEVSKIMKYAYENNIQIGRAHV